MKSFLMAVVIAVGLAVAGAYVLDSIFQKPVEVAFSTSSVRL